MSTSRWCVFVIEQPEVEAHLRAIEKHIAEVPETATSYLNGLQGQLIGLAKKALYRKALACTEWSAAWCDIHGTCSCGEDREYGEWHTDCPLHGEQSEHAEKDETED